MLNEMNYVPRTTALLEWLPHAITLALDGQTHHGNDWSTAAKTSSSIRGVPARKSGYIYIDIYSRSSSCT